METELHPLKRHRVKNALSVLAMAQQVDVHSATICRIESGEQYPRPQLLAKLVATTGIPAEHFLPPLPKNWKKRCG